ncbi:MAG TPA: oligosaccharide flippase family protein [Chryseolinea sp.]
MLKKFFSDSVIYAIGPQVPKLIGLLLLPILTKHLTAEDYAIWGIATAYIAGLNGLRDLGFTQVIVNYFFRYYYSEKRWQMVWRQIFGFLIVWGIGYTLLLGVVIYFSLRHKVGGNINVILACTLLSAFFFDLVILFGSRLYQFKAKPIPVALNAVVSGTVSVVVTYVTVVHFQLQYLSFFLALFASSFVSSILYGIPLFLEYKITPIFRFGKKMFRRHLQVGLPTIPHNYSSYLLNASDRVVLDIYKMPLNQVGQYNFAYTFGNYAELVGGAIGNAFSPVFGKLYAAKTPESDQKVRLITFVMQSLFLLASVLVALWAREILGILSSNDELAAAYPFAIVIIMSYVYRPMYWVPVNKLGFEEKTHLLWRISLVGGLINVGLNLIFLPIFGIYTVVVATFIGLMYIGFSGYFLKEFKKIDKLNYYPLHWLTLIVACTVATYFVRDYSILFKVSSTIFVLVIAAAAWWKNRIAISQLAAMNY